jgi:hypothetical protein
VNGYFLFTLSYKGKVKKIDSLTKLIKYDLSNLISLNHEIGKVIYYQILVTDITVIAKFTKPITLSVLVSHVIVSHTTFCTLSL